MRKIPEKNELAVVGIEVYVLRGNRYRSSGYTPYLKTDLAALESFLHDFSGIVIGHNILNFDYRVLRTAISLEDVIEKTVDTLWFLRQKDEEGWATLGLDSLAKTNFGRGKMLNSRKIPELWNRR